MVKEAMILTNLVTSHLTGKTEDELVQLSRQGNQEAFAELIRRTHQTCFKVAVSILREWQEAEDEIQNAFWKAFQHIDQFQQDSRFSTWMTRIVVNQCLMRLRSMKRAKFLFLDDTLAGDERVTMELVDGGLGPEAQLGSREVKKLLHREIGRIPPLLRNVFVLRDVDELPMPLVAERLGISVAAAKSRLLRARTELRGRLEKHCGRAGHASLSA